MRFSWLTLLALIAVGAWAQAPTLNVDFSKSPVAEGAPEWRPFDGVWTQRGDEFVQTETDYDNGIAYREPLGSDAQFFFEVTVRPVDLYMGGGLFFNMQSNETRNRSQMVRLDEGNLLAGYFDAKGDYQVSAVVGLNLPNGTHRVGVVGNNRTGSYYVYVNGKRVTEALTMEFTKGFFGLDSSGGPQAFRRVTMRTATNRELTGLTDAPAIRNPRSVATVGDYVVVAGGGQTPLTLWDKAGKRVASFGSELGDPGRVVGTEDGFFVLDRADSRLWRYALTDVLNKNTAPAGSIELPKGAVDFTLAGFGATPMWDKYLFVLTSDKKIHRTTTKTNRDWPGEWNEVVTLKPEDQPTAISADPDAVMGIKLYVSSSDYGRARFEIIPFRGAADQLTRGEAISAWLDPRDFTALPNGRFLHFGGLDYYGPHGALRVVRQDGSRVAHAALYAVGDLTKRGGVATDGQTVYVADASANVVYKVPINLPEVDPVATPRPDGSLSVAWTSPVTGEKGYVLWGTSEDESKWRRVEASGTGGSYRATLPAKPNQRVFYRFYPVYESLPANRPSRIFSTMTAPPRGKRQAAEIRVLNVIYLNALLDGKTKVSISGEGVLEKAKLEYEKARLFFWRNSRARFHLNYVDWVVITDTEAKVNAGWLPPAQARQDALPYLQRMGKKLSDYDSVIATWPNGPYDPTKPDELGAVGGGGLTPYGYSTFAINGNLAWLVVHEFQHQLDAFYEASRLTKMWLNHPEPTIHPGRYGQHFDVNAFIMREWRDDEYLGSLRGRIITFDDRDGDGLPDNDKRLPMDERRLGSNPRVADTDGDGLNDLGEFMAGTFSSSDPRKPDTDGDGLADGRDRYPLYQGEGVALPLGVNAGSVVTVYPRLTADETDPRTEEMRNRFAGLRVATGWQPQALTLVFHTSQELSVELDLDADNNGWFTGKDNVEVRASTIERIANRPEGVTLVRRGEALVLTVPAGLFGRAELREGYRFGMRLRVRNQNGAVSLFEPWYLHEVTLRSAR